MTEQEWQLASEPTALLNFCRTQVSDRKLWLFSFACFCRLLGLLPDPRQRQAVQALEKLAEGSLPKKELRRITRETRSAIPPENETLVSCDDPHYIGLMLYREFCSSRIAIHAIQASAGLTHWTVEQKEQTRLFREILGNPFRPVVFDPSWRTSTVMALAAGIYDEKAFDRLPISADALQDAGCYSDELLNHLRQPSGHCRGCWALDLVLGRE